MKHIDNFLKKLKTDRNTFATYILLMFSIYIVVDRFIEIIDTLKKNNFEPKVIKFIYDRIDKKSTLVLIQSQKNAKSGLIIDSPLVLYNDDGSITKEYKSLQEKVIK